MDYTTLIAGKGVAGSLLNWVPYTKLDQVTIVDEMQALLWGTLRVREMMTEYFFRIPAGNSEIVLPARFLDPIGEIWCPTLNTEFQHRDESVVKRRRTYTTTSGNLGASPFTTTNLSASVSVNLAGHGFNQGGVFTIAGATAVNGITPNGTFPITSITDVNNFVVDTTVLGTTASGAGSGGGSGATYSCDNLVQAFPRSWAIWNETIKFDGAFTQDCSCHLIYYQSLAKLSGTNTTNFLTNRYPQLVRTACQAAAADFMRDTEEYNKLVQRLTALASSIMVENEGFRRGSIIDVEIP